MRTILVDIGPLVHLSGVGPLSGQGLLDEDSLIAHDKGIIIEGNEIIAVENSEDLIEEYGIPNTTLNSLSEIKSSENKIISLEGRSVIPGLVDSHAHIIWAGDRSREIRWKQNGKTYSEIASMGGGIVSTVNQTRTASEKELFQLGKTRLEVAFQSGTTHIESKSGYGLNTDTELRLMDV